MSLIIDNPVNREADFTKELTHLLNRYGWDTKTATPDYLLAEHFLLMLHATETLVKDREHWFGREESEIVNVT